MRTDTFNNQFSEVLERANKAKAKAHIKSGKISPSKFAKTDLEVCLSLLGVPTDPPDHQSLRNFLRGITLEEVAITAISRGRQTAEMQAEVSYRKGVGLIDYYDEIPHEIKSAGANAWRYVKKAPKKDHCWQAAWYALATGKTSAWLHYINADTFEIISYRIYAKVYKEEIDTRIDRLHAYIRNRILPDFRAIEPYHTNLKYTDYPEFHGMNGMTAEQLLRDKYPNEYMKLKSGHLIESVCD